MKATELMIGDWVCYDGDVEYSCPIKIEGMDVSCDFCITSDRDDVGFGGVMPIPLTAEILEKNGWVFNDVPFIDGWEFMGITICDWSISCGINISMNVRYVHELQHALRLCGMNELADNFKI